MRLKCLHEALLHKRGISALFGTMRYSILFMFTPRKSCERAFLVFFGIARLYRFFWEEIGIKDFAFRPLSCAPTQAASLLNRRFVKPIVVQLPVSCVAINFKLVDQENSGSIQKSGA